MWQVIFCSCSSAELPMSNQVQRRFKACHLPAAGKCTHRIATCEGTPANHSITEITTQCLVQLCYVDVATTFLEKVGMEHIQWQNQDTSDDYRLVTMLPCMQSVEQEACDCLFLWRMQLFSIFPVFFGQPAAYFFTGSIRTLFPSFSLPFFHQELDRLVSLEELQSSFLHCSRSNVLELESLVCTSVGCFCVFNRNLLIHVYTSKMTLTRWLFDRSWRTWNNTTPFKLGGFVSLANGTISVGESPWQRPQRLSQYITHV